MNDFKSHITTNLNIEIKNNSAVVTSGNAMTGMTAQIGDKNYTIVVRGDLSGNGDIDMTDIAMLKQDMVDLISLNQPQELSADLNGNYSTDQIGNLEMLIAAKFKLINL